MNLLMLTGMPPGPANRTRRQLPGAATSAVAVCNFSATPVGEADQHLTARQQRCEELRKRSLTLRSHARESVDGRGIEHIEKNVRYATTQRSAAGALPGGKHPQQRGHIQRQDQQQQFTPRCTRWSKSEVAASCSTDVQNAFSKSVKISTSAATLSAVDMKDLATAETAIEAASTAAATPLTAENTAVSSAAGSASASPEPASSETGSIKEDENARQNTDLETTDPVRDGGSSEEASVKLDAGGSRDNSSSKSQCCLDSSCSSQTSHEVEREKKISSGQQVHTGTDNKSEKKGIAADNSAYNAEGEAPLHSEPETSSLEGGTPKQGSSLSMALLLARDDDVRRALPDATPEGDRNFESRETPATEQQGKQELLVSVGGSPKRDDAVDVLHNTGEYHSIEQQRGLPEQTAHFQAGSIHRCQPKVAEASGNTLHGAEQPPSLWEPASARQARQSSNKNDNASQVSAEHKEALHQRTQESQALQEGNRKRSGRQSEDEQALCKAQTIGQRSDEPGHGWQPASPVGHQEEEEEEERHHRQSLGGGGGELDKQVSCACAGALEKQDEGQRTGKSEDIRFFLRLGGGSGDQTSSPRSVHVSSAFLKDSWRAQRFFCKLFGVDIGEVIGLVDDQGFVSPFDGEELFIRDGGTYTLELVQNARRSDLTEFTEQNFPAASHSLGGRTDQYAHQRARAGGPVPCGVVAEESRRTDWISSFNGKKGMWQPSFAKESIPGKHEAVMPMPDGERKLTLGHFVSTRTASYLHGQEATPQEFSREERSIGAVAERTATKRGGIHQDLVDERQTRAVLPSAYHLLPPTEHQQAWTQSCSSVASGSARIKDACGESVMLHGQEAGEAQEMLEQFPSCTIAATSRVITRSMRQPCAVGYAPGFVSNDIKSKNLLHRRPVDHSSLRGGGEAVNEKKAQEFSERNDGQRLRAIKQEASAEEGSSALQQRLRRESGTWCAVGDSREGVERSSFGKAAADAQGERRSKQQWLSSSHVEEAASTDVTDEDVFLTEQVAAKRCRLEDGRRSSLSQHLGAEGQYITRSAAPNPLPGVVEEELLQKKQQQARHSSSKLWISAPLLVWRRRRLRRSLALHEPEDPEEVATRQLVAEQHVRAVLARVSQRKALRNHLQTGPGAQTEQEWRDSDTTKVFRKEASPPVPTVPPKNQLVEGSNKKVMNSSSWPSSRTSASAAPDYGEPLLVDSLLWKKATTEKIYVHQTSSYGGSTSYATKENTTPGVVHQGSFGRRSSPILFSGDHNQQHIVNQQQPFEQQPRWRELQRSSCERGVSSASSGILGARKEAAAGTHSKDENMKEEDEETSRCSSKLRESASTTGSSRQYLLRPRLAHTQIRTAAYPEEVKDYSSSSNDYYSSLQRRQVQSTGKGTALRDGFHPCDDDCVRRPPSGGERQDDNFPSFSRRPSKLNKTELNSTVQACNADARAQEVVVADAAVRRFRSETSGAQGLLTIDRLDKAASPERFHGSTEENGATAQASSAEIERLGIVSYGGSRNSSTSSGSSFAASGSERESEKPGCRSERQTQQQFLQQILEKRLFTSSELQRLLAVLETLKPPKHQQPQHHSLVEQLRVLLPPQTFSNLKLLLPSLLKTAERLKKTDAKDEEKSLQKRESGRRISTAASQADEIDTHTPAVLNPSSGCDTEDKKFS